MPPFFESPLSVCRRGIWLIPVAAILLFLKTTAASGPTTDTQVRPNVVFILADDLGWSDTTLFGTTKFYQTPNIERLARRGMLFRRAYSASPLCSPTRASILTGLNPARIGITAPNCHLKEVRLKPSVSPRAPMTAKVIACNSATRLATDYYTLSEALHDTGYATGHFGKWHLGPEPYDPLHHGFDVDVPHWPGPGPAGSYVAPWRFPRFKERVPHEHVEDRMGDEAVAFMQQHKDEPFLLNYWQFSVHAPFDAKPALIEKHRARVDPTDAQRSPTYAAMVESLDDNVGKILDTLEQLEIADRTIIIFYSDNGGNMYNEIDGTTPTSNRPLRGGKATMYEGGVRVPCIVCWPGVVRGSTTSDTMIQSVDLYPTLLEMLGQAPRPGQTFDGMSIVPALRADGEAAKPLVDRAIFTYFPHSPKVPDHLPPAVSVHQGDWKLIRLFHDGEAGKHRYELYNLQEDLGEQNNLADTYPQLVSKLDSLIEEFLHDTHAVVPIANPDYDPVSATLAQFGVVAANQCKLTLHTGQLQMESTGDDPHFSLQLAQPTPATKLTLELRMKTSVSGMAHVYWQEKGVAPAFHRSRRVELTPIADGVLHDYRIVLPAKGSTTNLRLDLLNSPGSVVVDSIRLLDAEDNELQQWDFE